MCCQVTHSLLNPLRGPNIEQRIEMTIFCLEIKHRPWHAPLYNVRTHTVKSSQAKFVFRALLNNNSWPVAVHINYLNINTQIRQTQSQARQKHKVRWWFSDEESCIVSNTWPRMLRNCRGKPQPPPHPPVLPVKRAASRVRGIRGWSQ